MEDNTARMNEIEEIEVVDEVTETSEDSNAGAFVAGIIGGFLAYGIITGAKRLAGFISTKLEARKHKEAMGTVIDAEIIDEETEQADSDEEPDK